MIIRTILDTIGATPPIEFTGEQYPMPEGTKIYAKLEYLNPGGQRERPTRRISSRRSNESREN